MNFKRYEIEERKFTSNALIGVEEYINSLGEVKERRVFLLTFFNLKKVEADREIEKLKKLL